MLIRFCSITLLTLIAWIDASAQVALPHQPVGSRSRHQVVQVTGGLSYPWSIAFLPDGRALITERQNGVRVLSNGVLSATVLQGLPAAFQGSEAGYLGLAVDPQFTSNRRIYVCLTLGTEASNGSAVIRGQLNQSRLDDVVTIFEARPAKDRPQHFGCRMVIGADGSLFVTVGDGYHFRDQAQDLASDLGKVVRIDTDGRAPPNNPFRNRPGARPEIFTLGHRNPQGLALRPGTSEVWLHEHGPRGGDEVNVLVAGSNYGWPRVTYGIDYSGEQIASAPLASGIQGPRYYWVPSIAPSGMTFYDGSRFPEWRGDLFVGALAGRALHRLDLEDSRVIGQEILLAGLKERIRDVQQGPDGCLYVLTDAADGKLLRIEPAPLPASTPKQ